VYKERRWEMSVKKLKIFQYFYENDERRELDVYV
jgi:hypothetical protein